MSCAILSPFPGMSFNSSTVAVLTFKILSDMPLNNECKLFICVIFQCEFRKLCTNKLYTKLSRSGFRLCDGSGLGACLLVGWWGLVLWLFFRPTGVYLLDFFCSGFQFYLLLSPYLCFISLLYLDLYVFGDDAWIM